jgi:hypothetical protein
MDRVYGMVDRVHGAGSRGLWIPIKWWPSIVGWDAEINLSERIFHVLISAVDQATYGSWQLRPATAVVRLTEPQHCGLLLWRDILAATVSFSRWGLHLRGQREVGTQLGWFLGGSSDRRILRDSGPLASIFSDHMHSGGQIFRWEEISLIWNGMTFTARQQPSKDAP